jgi:hypothetical protein
MTGLSGPFPRSPIVQRGQDTNLIADIPPQGGNSKIRVRGIRLTIIRVPPPSVNQRRFWIFPHGSQRRHSDYRLGKFLGRGTWILESPPGVGYFCDPIHAPEALSPNKMCLGSRGDNCAAKQMSTMAIDVEIHILHRVMIRSSSQYRKTLQLMKIKDVIML